MIKNEEFSRPKSWAWP